MTSITNSPVPPEAGAAEAGKSLSSELLWGYRELLIFATVMVVAQVLVTAAAVMIGERFYALDQQALSALVASEPGVAVPMQLAAWVPPLCYIALVVTVRYGRTLRAGLAWHPLRGSLFRNVRTGIGLAIASAIASVAIGDPEQQQPMERLFENRDSLWILALYGVAIAPCIEEVVFRGFVFGAIERRHGTWTALAVTTVVFSGLHGAQYGWSWQHLAVLTAVGCVLGVIRIRSGSSRASAVTHISYNGTLLLAVTSLQHSVG